MEGLNSILDHRGSIFIPELGEEVKAVPSFRIFACQNPYNEGGGRKGLPKSFLNRFIKVYLNKLEKDDLSVIINDMYPDLVKQEDLISKMIEFNEKVNEDVNVRKQK